jgi:hypothetical protein
MLYRHHVSSVWRWHIIQNLHSFRISITRFEHTNFLSWNMSVEIGFDPFNFAIALVALIMTAMNLYWTHPRNTRTG